MIKLVLIHPMCGHIRSSIQLEHVARDDWTTPIRCCSTMNWRQKPQNSPAGSNATQKENLNFWWLGPFVESLTSVIPHQDKYFPYFSVDSRIGDGFSTKTPIHMMKRPGLFSFKFRTRN